jgi:hypothetical protein
MTRFTISGSETREMLEYYESVEIEAETEEEAHDKYMEMWRTGVLSCVDSEYSGYAGDFNIETDEWEEMDDEDEDEDEEKEVEAACGMVML